MITLLLLTAISQSPGWRYSDFADDPAQVKAFSYGEPGEKPFELRAPTNPLLRPVKPPAAPPAPVATPPPERRPTAEPGPPPAPPPQTWELKDSAGVLWTHPDPDFLRKVVRQRNAEIAASRTIRQSLPPTICQPGTPCGTQ